MSAMEKIREEILGSAVCNSCGGERGGRGEDSHHDCVPGGRKKGESGRTGAESPASYLAAAITAAARQKLAIQPQPKVDYPTDALGPIAPAATAIAECGQMSLAMAGQSVLAASSLLAQSVADVQTLAGVKPLSLYCFTIADSGDGKSTAEGVALRPIHEGQRRESETYRKGLKTHESKSRKKAQDGDDAEIPRAPYRIMRDGTVEGIRHSFKTGVPSQGVFTAEAAIMVAGYGMAPDNKAKTCATFNALWDDGEVSVSRSMSGRVQLYGRRLCVHWMIQPEAARGAVMDPLMSSIGFWPRFLLAWPESAPPRRAIPFHPDRDARITDYWRECDRLLACAMGDDCGSLLVIEPTREAEALACKFFERMEQAKDPSSQLSTIKPFALRATEQAFRVAGVLAVMGRQDTIDAGTMANAIQVIAYSLESWCVLFGSRESAEASKYAIRLIEWLVKQPDMTASEISISSIGPKTIRSRSRRDAALATLEQHGLIRCIGGNRWCAEVDI